MCNFHTQKVKANYSWLACHPCSLSALPLVPQPQSDLAAGVLPLAPCCHAENFPPKLSKPIFVHLWDMTRISF